ncbi:MAG: NAD(+) kinase [Gammaproteobacteria bacterium]|nr:NAD(+) kinase [Gammaproteobacteria bacterium]MCW5582994.1 NAD(+) kinase [Gammaproteobacteria bacterium]
MARQFKTIGIFGRVKNPGVIETLKALISYLRNLNQEILIDSETADALEDTSLVCINRSELSKRCNLLIVVGGDGSLLHAAHTIVNDEIPVLGINRGRLGFLTDILPTDLTRIKSILEGDYILEKRFLLSATVEHHDTILGHGDALNEIALIPDSVPHMNEFEIFINHQFVCSQDSDGVIVATPTGSTAYALSGGGPILHPQLDAIVIVPMFPHTLSIRPIVIEGNHRITIVITPNNTATPRLACDSQTFINTPPGSHINIQKKDQHLHLIHPLDYDYYETLRSKLHWGRKLHYVE